MPSRRRPSLPLIVFMGLLGAVSAHAAESWTSTGSMSSARSDHTATLLHSGQVLVTGGKAGDTTIGTAELYDPATGTWQLTGSMASPRSGHTATLMPSGQVLVVGGADGAGAALGTAELYDPDTGSWSPTGSLHRARKGAAAILLRSGQVLVAGGHNGKAPLGAAELYDPVASSWSATGPMPAWPTPQAVLLPSGNVLVVGQSENRAAGIYYSATRNWSSTAPMGWQRLLPAIALLPSGQVLVTGGSTGSAPNPFTETYFPDNGLWTARASMVSPRMGHTATLLPSSKVLVMGGAPENERAVPAELYDPVTDTWSPTGPPGLSNRTRHTATLLYSGQVLIAGGVSGATLASAQLSLGEGRTPPVAWPLQAAMAEDTSSPVALVGLDADGDPLMYSVLAGPAHGTLSGTAPSLTYVPEPNFHGADLFTYSVSDGTMDSSPVTVRLKIVPVNDPPQAPSLSLETSEATPLPLPLPETDIDGDKLRYTVLTKPAHGKLQGTAPNLTFVPPAGGYGQDSFTYRVHDLSLIHI